MKLQRRVDRKDRTTESVRKAHFSRILSNDIRDAKAKLQDTPTPLLLVVRRQKVASSFLIHFSPSPIPCSGSRAEERIRLFAFAGVFREGHASFVPAPFVSFDCEPSLSEFLWRYNQR